MSELFLLTFSQIAPATPPRNMVNTTRNGTRMPMPMPVGDGTHFFSFLFDSRTVNTTPSTEKMISMYSADVGNAPGPFSRICANPAHFCEIGDDRPAFTSSVVPSII